MATWWDVAKSWRHSSWDVPHGRIETRLADFAASLCVVELTVRRAAAALRFAERLAQQRRIAQPDCLRDVAITYLETLQRMDRIDPAEVDRLLPHVVGGGIRGPELRRAEAELRRNVAASGARSDGALLRMEAGTGRRRALELLASAGSPLHGRLLRPRRADALRPLVVDAVAVSGDVGAEVLQGVRVFTAVSGARHPRHVGYAALLGLAGARVLDGFHLVFEEAETTAEVLRALRGWEATGVGVIQVTEDGSLKVEIEARLGRAAEPELAAARRWILEGLGRAVRR